MAPTISRQLLCLALLSLLSLSTFAQAEVQSQETIKIKTDLVVLDAQVTDKSAGRQIGLISGSRGWRRDYGKGDLMRHNQAPAQRQRIAAAPHEGSAFWRLRR